MSQQTNYYKLGLFIIAGTVLFIAVVIAVGAGKFFQKTLAMETYVDESINGLEVGSPIKFRGVKVGSVSKIGFVTEKDGDFVASKYKYVLIEGILGKKHFYGESIEEIEKGLQKEIEKGLRIRPTSQGVTGQLFLDVNYLDPKLNPPLKIPWKPKGIYIPSAPSTLSQIEEAFDTISQALNSIDKTDLKGAIEDLKNAAQSISDFLKKADLGDIGEGLAATLKETRTMFARVNQLLDTPKAETILPDASRSMAGLRRIVEDSGDNIVSAAHDIRQAAAGLNTTSEKANEAAAQLNDVLGRVNRIVAGQQVNIQAILEDLRRVLENIRELSNEAKRYPSGVLFGEPPNKAKVKQ